MFVAGLKNYTGNVEVYSLLTLVLDLSYWITGLGVWKLFF